MKLSSSTSNTLFESSRSLGVSTSTRSIGKTAFAAQNLRRQGGPLSFQPIKNFRRFTHYLPHLVIIFFMLLILPFMFGGSNDATSYVQCPDGYAVEVLAISLEDITGLPIAPSQATGSYLRAQGRAQTTFIPCDSYDNYRRSFEHMRDGLAKSQKHGLYQKNQLAPKALYSPKVVEALSKIQNQYALKR